MVERTAHRTYAVDLDFSNVGLFSRVAAQKLVLPSNGSGPSRNQEVFLEINDGE